MPRSPDKVHAYITKASPSHITSLMRLTRRAGSEVMGWTRPGICTSEARLIISSKICVEGFCLQATHTTVESNNKGPSAPSVHLPPLPYP